MKTKRHSKILELISEKDIATQEDLLVYLRESGFDVTQATVSRDIKELRLVKTMVSDGKYRYSPASSDSNSDVSTKYAVFSQSAKSVDYANNMIVIKCYTGMASAACAVLDAMNHEGVVGTLAGDDTIFVLMRDEKMAVSLVDTVRKLID
ncbi:MAG: arginine repressor [Oscillospiraceae bacterium]|nr:arginine repressor [Oscillospiraceae bacterium]MBQ4546801.1 arginine repressor [Oscillospiraceae bacterium]